MIFFILRKDSAWLFRWAYCCFQMGFLLDFVLYGIISKGLGKFWTTPCNCSRRLLYLCGYVDDNTDWKFLKIQKET